MTEHALTPGAEREAAPTEPAVACGAVLREARARTGMSIDTVAQLLKLHPKQVQALEEGRHDLLPGRTFVRGFLRNYARALNLDPERLLAMLPDTPPATLASTTHSMGEIRFDTTPKRSWSRWLIPLVLVALVALAAVYEFLRPIGAPQPGDSEPATPRAEETAPPGPAGAGPSAGGGTMLPNPLTSESTRASEPTATAAAPTTAGTAATGASGGVVSTAIPPSAPGDATLVIVYGGRSWTEVRDANGKVLLSLTGSPGMTQSVTGTPPLDVIIGSVADVSMRYRGSPVDLSSYRRANVARLRLD